METELNINSCTLDAEAVKIIIKQLEVIKKELFSPDNDSLFDDCRNRLMENAPAGLKSQLSKLSYCYYENSIWSEMEEPSKNVQDIQRLIQLYQEKLFEMSNPTSQIDLYKKKLLKAKNNSIDFISKLGEMVVGDTANFPYRSSSYITKFFEESGFPLMKHDGSTRRIWAAEQLEKMSLDELYTIVSCLFKRKYFNTDGVDLAKAKEIFTNELELACRDDEMEDMSEIFNININSSLLFNQNIVTSDAVLNEDIDQARQFYLGGNLQSAVEKIWDAFERVKSHYNKDKKASVSAIVNTLSDEIKTASSSKQVDADELFFNTEIKNITSIGNTYKIRHSEVTQKEIANEFTKKYLFFKVLNLINLIHERMGLNLTQLPK